MGLKTTGTLSCKCLRAFGLIEIGRARSITRYASRKLQHAGERLNSTTCEKRGLAPGIRTYASAFLSIKHFTTFSAQPSLLSFPTLPSPLNLTTQHHIPLPLLVAMHFFHAIVSFTLTVGCVALAFPNYDWVKVDPLHRRAEPNAPAKLAHRDEIAPLTDFALPPRSDIVPRGSRPPPPPPPPPSPPLLITLKDGGKATITFKNRTITVEGPAVIRLTPSSLEISNAGKVVLNVTAIQASDSS